MVPETKLVIAVVLMIRILRRIDLFHSFFLTLHPIY